MACRTELKDLPHNATPQEQLIAFKKMFASFKKKVAEAGILHQCKQREAYESPGEKRRRKRKEAANNLMKSKLRENFPER
jgi:ribosomal protein S21